jgi:hypothetical protein
MGKKLARNVYALDGTYYEAGSTPSKEHAEEFSNPKVWEDPDAVVVQEADVLDPAPAPEGVQVVPADDQDADPADKVAPKAPVKKAPAKKSAPAS